MNANSEMRSLFFFNDTATTEIYTLSLHDALPIYHVELPCLDRNLVEEHGRHDDPGDGPQAVEEADRKSTRLNSSHLVISYAVFCLKKKKTTSIPRSRTNTHCAIQHNHMQ